MNKAIKEITTIDHYIETFPKSVQTLLSQMRTTVQKAAPQATEKISYRMPTFYYNGNLVHFAAFQHHIGFYPTDKGVAAFQEELKGYKSAKGSVQFPITEPLPLKLISKIVKFRVEQNAEKEAPKRPASKSTSKTGKKSAIKKSAKN